MLTGTLLPNQRPSRVGPEPPAWMTAHVPNATIAMENRTTESTATARMRRQYSFGLGVVSGLFAAWLGALRLQLRK